MGRMTADKSRNLAKVRISSAGIRLARSSRTTLSSRRSKLATLNAASMYQKTVPSDRKIETPDKQNSFFVAGQLSKLNDEDPDYPALVMANYMFGGSSLGTRLSRRIRDKEGLSYGVQSEFAVLTKDDAATFVGVALSAPQNTPKVEASFRDELAKTLKDGFTADEVAAAKKAWIQ